MIMPIAVRAALNSIKWEYEENEWLGNLTYQATEDDWQALRAVTAMMRMPYNHNRKRFVLPDPFEPQELIEMALDANEVPNPKNNDFFPTPAAGATEIATIIAKDNPRTILEPEAGSGAIVQALLTACPDAKITAVENDPLNVRILRHLYPTIEIVEADFLDWAAKTNRKFDAVAMNPPFAAGGGYQAHIRAAMQCLTGYGILVSVTPKMDTAKPEWKTWLREHRAEVEEFQHKFEDTAIETLHITLANCPPWLDKPHDNYPSARTAILDVALCSDKKADREIGKWIYQVFEKQDDPVMQYAGYKAALQGLTERFPKDMFGIYFTDDEYRIMAWETYTEAITYNNVYRPAPPPRWKKTDTNTYYAIHPDHDTLAGPFKTKQQARDAWEDHSQVKVLVMTAGLQIKKTMIKATEIADEPPQPIVTSQRIEITNPNEYLTPLPPHLQVKPIAVTPQPKVAKPKREKRQAVSMF